jgi:RNA polymerase sigma factor (sigma-70 family)
MIPNPLTDTSSAPEDMEMVARAKAGNRDALEQLITRHQRWIYNIVLRMVYVPQDAEDITQEILIKLITKLSTFEGRSSLRTWLYRIAVHHVLNMKRTKSEEYGWTFDKYGNGLRQAPDEELPDPRTIPVDLQLLVEESKIGCTSGMLLCLTREQRLVYILGEIFGVTDLVGAELLETSRDNFRQKLSRARRDLHHFMHDQCGLINEANPCRCAKKTQAFMRAGYLDPSNLVFAKSHVTRVREVAPKALGQIEALDAAYAEIHRAHPFQAGPDFVSALRKLIAGATLAVMAVVMTGCVRTATDDFSPDAIVALEKGALDRWGNGDPGGYYEIIAADETYFDPTTDRRIDGLDAVKAHFAPFDGKIHIDRYEMIAPKVQREGNLAVLTFNLVDSGARVAGVDQGTQRWNSTEVYRRIGGAWKIVHSHWSYVKAAATPAPPAGAPPAPAGASSPASATGNSHRP